MNLRELGEEIGLDEDEYRELVELFLETGAADYEHLKAAFHTGDARQVARKAHTISGASGNLRLMNIHAMAKRIELAADDNGLDAVAGDVAAIQGFFDEIARCIQV